MTGKFMMFLGVDSPLTTIIYGIRIFAYFDLIASCNHMTCREEIPIIFSCAVTIIVWSISM